MSARAHALHHGCKVGHVCGVCMYVHVGMHAWLHASMDPWQVACMNVCVCVRISVGRQEGI